MNGNTDLSLDRLRFEAKAAAARHSKAPRKTIAVSKLAVIVCLSLVSWAPVAVLVRVMTG